MKRSALLGMLLVLFGCGDGDTQADASIADAGSQGIDAAIDAGARRDGGRPDAGAADAGTDAAEPEETRFTFIVIPDTQNEVLSDRNAERLFQHRIDWIADNAEAMSIRFVTHTGDLANWDTPGHDQYARASAGFERLDAAGIPYVIAIGNHDTAATCEGGSACSVPGMSTNDLLRDTSTFNTYFPTTRFPALAGVFEDGKVDNAYHTVRAGGLNWLILSLELWARTEAYEWVDGVLAAHPDHNVIVITHSHLTAGGDIRDDNGGYGDNSPRHIFDEVLSQHANVRFIFSGHEGQAAFREDTGSHGNTIYQFLNAFHDTSTNLLRIVEIDSEANTIDTRIYGPSTGETRDGEGTTVSLGDVEWVR